MEGIEEIESAIDRLTPDDIRQLAKWLRKREASLVESALDAGYSAMALAADREREAFEWSEGLIGDMADNRQDAPG
jgi:hypothetical protein